MKIYSTIILMFIFSVAMLFGTQAWSSEYKRLKQKYEHASSSFYRQSIKKHPDPVANKKGDIKEKELEFYELKNRWNELITKTYTDKSVFDFNSAKAKRIRETAESEGIIELLKREIDRDILIFAAYERNPGLKAARLKWESTVEKYSQATQLDNVLRQYQSFVKDANTKVGSMKNKVAVKETFPFPGTLALKGDIVEKEIMIAREEYFVVLKNLVMRISQSFDELVFVIEAISITTENLDLLKVLESTASIKYSTGSSGFNDVIKAQIEILKLSTELEILKDQKKTISAKINEDLNLPMGFISIDPDKRKILPLNYTLEDLYKKGMKHRQELNLLRHKIEKANLAIMLAEKKFYPDFTQGLSYFENDKGNFIGLGKDAEAFKVKPASMPNFWFGKNDAYVREARLRYQSLKEMLTEKENKVLFNIRDMVFHLDKSEKQIRLYAGSLATGTRSENSLLAQSRKAVDIAQVEYESGKIDFLNLLDAQKKFLDFSLNYARAEKEYNQNFARLENIVGVGLH